MSDAGKPRRYAPKGRTPMAKQQMKKRVKAGTSKASAAQRRALFVEAYIANGGNNTQAAITAGFSPKGADAVGARLSGDVRLRAAIEKRQAELRATLALTTEKVLREVARICHFDIRKLYREDGSLKAPGEIDDDTAAALVSIKVQEMAGGLEIKEGGGVRHIPMFTKEVKAFDKNAALEKAMKYLGLFKKDNEQQPPPVVVRGTRAAKFQPYRGRTAT